MRPGASLAAQLIDKALPTLERALIVNEARLTTVGPASLADCERIGQIAQQYRAQDPLPGAAPVADEFAAQFWSHRASACVMAGCALVIRERGGAAHAAASPLITAVLLALPNQTAAGEAVLVLELPGPPDEQLDVLAALREQAHAWAATKGLRLGTYENEVVTVRRWRPIDRPPVQPTGGGGPGEPPPPGEPQ